ncbi:DUF2931 family protein [Stutzerimonas stutzeri]|jgi:hypothetical protein|uniref:DUF2931 family protein n=1 Tax=Stutzerimonas stutzeri TaxID=316 RepID=A0ABD4Y6P0_STUST|nr:DUF2931 family protein [Stutzerimonas stutzeri]MDH0085268.1 DUF2931 family protein [Stutzerimonas stutzeri]MDH0690783.1 DUF2931 family protein [Stutzerimonas stutzeri]
MALGKTFLLACTLALLSGCAASQAQPKLPFDAWYAGTFAPDHMEVWVESVDVIDRRGLAYERVNGGVPSYSSTIAGWPSHPAGGAGKGLRGIDLPEIIFVRWQSLVEPQTYNVRINIPEWVREEMLKPQAPYCRGEKRVVEGMYRRVITIGLAPGGIAKAWVGGPCLQSIEIGRFEAAVSKAGPSLGQNEGRYAYPLSEKAKAYIEQHGVPYGSW